MYRKKVFLIAVCLVVIVSLFGNAAFASQHETGAGNFLNNIFQPFAGIDLKKTYDLAPNFIDAMFYFLFFIGVVQFALSGYFKGRGGTAVIIAFGAALAIGLAIWTSNIGFRLGDRIGPIAGAIFAILFFVMMVRLFMREGESMAPAFWVAYLLGFVFINFFVPEVFTTFSQNKYGSIAIAIANLLFFIALVYGLPSFLSRFWGGGGGRGGEGGRGGGFGGLFGGRREPETPEGREREAERRERKAEEEEEREAEEEKRREAAEELRTTTREVSELGKIYREIDEHKKRIVNPLLSAPPRPATPGGPPDWTSTINLHNSFIRDVKDDLNSLVVLDERVKEYANRMYESLRRRVSKRGRVRQRVGVRRTIAREVKEIYDRENLIENMINHIKSELDKTKDLGIIYATWATILPSHPYHYAGVPPYGVPTFPPGNESTILEGILRGHKDYNLRRVYNILATLINLERRVLREIR